MTRDKHEWAGTIFHVNDRRCEVIKVLAEGGFALIFLVSCGSERNYALKRQCVNDQFKFNQLKLEIETMKKFCGHSHVVPYIDSAINDLSDGVWEGLILMELCNGDLLHFMRSRADTRLSLHEINDIFINLITAISVLHHSNPPITHRDIKPENLLQFNGRFVLCDFGSATSQYFDPTKTPLSQIEDEINRYTTPAFRSPEMVDLYSGKLISCKSDIWALGCFLYFLFYWTTPFGDSVNCIQNSKLNYPKTVTIPPEYKDLIEFMLNPDPDLRPYISQVAQRAFSLTNKPCPILNEPDHAIVPVSPIISSSTNHTFATSPNSYYQKQFFKPVCTSIAPRTRPKPGKHTSKLSMSNITLTCFSSNTDDNNNEKCLNPTSHLCENNGKPVSSYTNKDDDDAFLNLTNVSFHNDTLLKSNDAMIGDTTSSTSHELTQVISHKYGYSNDPRLSNLHNAVADSKISPFVNTLSPSKTSHMRSRSDVNDALFSGLFAVNNSNVEPCIYVSEAKVVKNSNDEQDTQICDVDSVRLDRLNSKLSQHHDQNRESLQSSNHHLHDNQNECNYGQLSENLPEKKSFRLRFLSLSKKLN